MARTSASVEYTEAEAKAAIELLDLAVKHSGLAVAEAALVLMKKLQAAFQEPETPEPPE